MCIPRQIVFKHSSYFCSSSRFKQAAWRLVKHSVLSLLFPFAILAIGCGRGPTGEVGENQKKPSSDRLPMTDGPSSSTSDGLRPTQIATSQAAGDAGTKPPVSGKPIRLITKEVSLGTVPEESWKNTTDQKKIAVSPNGRRLAYPARKGSQWVVVVDGKEGDLRYEDIHQISFSPDNKRVAYRGVRGNRFFIVVDGKERANFPYFKTFYDFAANRNGGPGFTPDSKQFWFVGVEADGIYARRLYLDGKEVSGFQGIADDPVFGPDSKRIAAIKKNTGTAPKDTYSTGVVDGEADTGRYFGCAQPRFSPDGRRVAYVAHPFYLKPPIAVIDKKEQGGDVRHFRFSPDSMRVALIERYKVRMIPPVKEGSGEIHDMVFSPDSKHWAYAANRNNIDIVVKDGVEEDKGFPSIEAGSLLFSPDSKSLAYVVEHRKDGFNGKYSVVCGAAAGRQHAMIAPGSLVGSPGGDWLAYAATEGENQWHVAVMSPDGKAAAKGNSYTRFRTRNGIPFDRHTGSWAPQPIHDIRERNTLTFEGPQSLFAVVIRGREFLRVEITIAAE